MRNVLYLISRVLRCIGCFNPSIISIQCLLTLKRDGNMTNPDVEDPSFQNRIHLHAGPFGLPRRAPEGSWWIGWRKSWREQQGEVSAPVVFVVVALLLRGWNAQVLSARRLRRLGTDPDIAKAVAVWSCIPRWESDYSTRKFRLFALGTTTTKIIKFV